MSSRSFWGSYAAAVMLFGAAAQAEDCGELAKMKLPHVTITEAAAVAAGTVIESLAKAGVPPPTAAYCRIQATSRPTAASEIRFELWIPLDRAWNGKFEQVGNAGFAGVIPYWLMPYPLSLGYAVAGTDDGHRSGDVTDASWALNQPEKIKDYGWRAIRETSLASKQILRRLKSRQASKSYFVGCSDGGREALMMAQRFPTYFDGIIAGAPAYTMTRLSTGGAMRALELDAAPGRLPPAKLTLLQSHALQTCGSGARFLRDPRQCATDLAALKCTGSENDGCLSEAQIETARIVYRERADPSTGKPIYAVLPGAEAVKGSWDNWITGADDQGKSRGLQYAWNYMAYLVMNDPQLDIAKLTPEDMARGTRRLAPIIDSDSPDLSAFKSHGGKLIQYHGWNDPGIPPGFSLEYRDRLAQKTGGLEDFYRLYMVPGMLHCSGGDAPTEVNWQAALEAWVEHGSAPGKLVASDGKGASQTIEPIGTGAAAR